MGQDQTMQKALYKALAATGLIVKDHGTVLFTVSDDDKEEATELAERFYKIGYRILATEGTAKTFNEQGIPAESVDKISDDKTDLLDAIQQGKVQLVINTMTKGKEIERDGFRIRRESVDNGVPCLTSLDTASAIIDVIESMTFEMNAMNE